MTIQLEYISHLLQFFKIFPIMLALYLMLSLTYYAQNYAGIINWSLIIATFKLLEFAPIIPAQVLAF